MTDEKRSAVEEAVEVMRVEAYIIAEAGLDTSAESLLVAADRLQRQAAPNEPCQHPASQRWIVREWCPACGSAFVQTQMGAAPYWKRPEAAPVTQGGPSREALMELLRVATIHIRDSYKPTLKYDRDRWRMVSKAIARCEREAHGDKEPNR